MQVLLLILLFSLLFTLLLACLGVFINFGELVQLEHDQYREEWERDGRPYGFFHRPDTGEQLIFGFRRNPLNSLQTFILSLAWFLRTPRWAASDQEAIRILWWFRACWLYWNIGTLPLMIAFLLVWVDRFQAARIT